MSSLLSQLRDQRVTAGVSQRVLARELGWSQSEYSRFERKRSSSAATVTNIATVAAVLGLELSAGLHPDGEPIRDKGHQALIERFRRIISADFSVRAEVPLPGPGDPRVWDLVLRRREIVIGVEAETRIRDLQALVRRIHERELSGGVDEIIVVLSDSAVNRRLVRDLRIALGERYTTSPRSLRAMLVAVRGPFASGVMLI